MELDLCPGIALATGTFNAVIADERVLTGALNTNPELRRFMFLYVCGNYSRILPGISPKFSHFDVRRAFTAHQLLTILHEAHHTIVLVEHDPTLYEGDGGGELAGTVAHALKEAARESLVIIYAEKQDRALATLMRMADRVFYFAEPPAPAYAVAPRKGARRGGAGPLPGAQRRLEGV
jgi:DNA polymerase I